MDARGFNRGLAFPADLLPLFFGLSTANLKQDLKSPRRNERDDMCEQFFYNL